MSDAAMPQLLVGKTAVVMGIQNDFSIAYHIAEAFGAAGARLAMSVVDERPLRYTKKLEERYPGSFTFTCNVANDADLDAMQETLKRECGTVDAYVHAVAFSPKEALSAPFAQTTREQWQISLDISSYSLVAAAQRIAPLMPDGGSMMALTYLGADRYFPGYNIAGVAKAALESSVRYLAGDFGPRLIRVNGISSGPLKTAAARGIDRFSDMYETLAGSAPLARPFHQSDVAKTAVFLASDLSAAITGEVIFVDNGYHIMGMSIPREEFGG